MRLITIILSICLSFNIMNMQVYANDFNVEHMTMRESNGMVADIAYGIITNNTSYISNYANYFEPDCYSELYEYTMSNDLQFESIINSVIDFTYPDNSSTGDSVIMCNTKIVYTNNYTGMCLFEYHINALGKIYGYNIWVY